MQFSFLNYFIILLPLTFAILIESNKYLAHFLYLVLCKSPLDLVPIIIPWFQSAKRDTDPTPSTNIIQGANSVIDTKEKK